MARRTPLATHLIGRAATAEDLRNEGVPRSRLRAADVEHPFHGVHVAAGHIDGLRERAEALALILRRGEVFSHSTAARLLGAPLPSREDSELHVTNLIKMNRMRRPGVIGHRAHNLPSMLLGTLPIVTPAYVFFQLATILGHDDLVAVGDYLVTPNRHARTPAIATVAALRAAIPERARGAGRARSALNDVRVGAESRMETLTRLLLLRAGLPEPELNPEMPVEGRTLHPDLLYREWRIVLEYEGDGHRTDPKQWRRDISRREAFQAAGFRVIQVHKEDVLAEPEAFLARVCRAIAQRRTL